MAEKRTPPTWESTVFSVSPSSSAQHTEAYPDTFQPSPISPPLRIHRPKAELLGLGLDIPIKFEINSPSISSAEDLGQDTPIKAQDLPMTPGISPSPTSKTSATFTKTLRTPVAETSTPTKRSPTTSYFEFGLPSVQVKIPMTPTMAMLGSMIGSPSASSRPSISTPRSPLLSPTKHSLSSPVAPKRTHRSAILEKLKIGFPSSSEKNVRYLTMPSPTTASLPRRRFSWKRWLMVGMVAFMTVAVLQSILRTPATRRYRNVKYVGDREDGPSYHDPEGQERFKALMTFMQRESDDLAARVPVELPPEVQADEEYVSPAEEEMQEIQRGSGFKWKPEFEGGEGIHYGVEEDDEDYEAPPTWMQAKANSAQETGSLTSLDDRIGHSNRPSDAFGLNKDQIARLQALEERNAVSSLRAVIRFISMGGIFPESWFGDDYENMDSFPLDEALEKAWAEPHGLGLLPTLKELLGPTRSKQIFGPNWELLTDEAKRVVIFSKTRSRESQVVKNIVDSYNIMPLPHIVELDQRYDGTILEQIVQELTARRAVGNAVLNWKLLGGAEELMMADSEGTLARKLVDGGLKIQSRRW